jgi:HSP20 family molecular chaperone IbpA
VLIIEVFHNACYLFLLRNQTDIAPFKNVLHADLIETPTTYEVHCDLPGCDAKDLDVTVLDDFLHIKAERGQVHEHDTDTGTYFELNGKERKLISVIKNLGNLYPKLISYSPCQS